MRFYNLPQYITVTAPPNSLVDNLASTGVIGSLAFFFLVVVTMRAMNGLPRIYGTLGLVVLLGHYVDGLFDTFWIGACPSPRSSSPGSRSGWPTPTPTGSGCPTCWPARSGPDTRTTGPGRDPAHRRSGPG